MIQKEVILPVGVERVWEAWTTEKGIQSFFAKHCKVDFRVGGAFEMYFMPENEPGMRGSEGCQFMGIEAYKMISFSWNAPPQFPNTRAQRTFVVLRFTRTERGTLLRLSHDGWGSSEEWTATCNYFDEAWTRVLSNLKQTLVN